MQAITIGRIVSALQEACAREGVPEGAVEAVCHNTSETLGCCEISPMTVTIPTRSVAAIVEDTNQGEVVLARGRADAWVYNADSQFGYWTGPTLAVRWNMVDPYVVVALEPDPVLISKPWEERS